MKNIKQIYQLLTKANKQRTLFNTHQEELKILIKNGDVEKVKSIIDTGININQKGKNSITLLHLACEENNPEMIALLLSYKPNIYCTDKWLRTPIIIIASTEIKKIKDDNEKELAKRNTRTNAQQLIEYGMSVNERDKLDRTPLMYCAINDNDTLATYLLTHKKLDITLQDIGGSDALMTSFYESSHNVFKVLTTSARNSEELGYCIKYVRVVKGADAPEVKDLEKLKLVTKLEEYLPATAKRYKASKI